METGPRAGVGNRKGRHADGPSPDDHSSNDPSREVRGPIAYMARNGVAANLLMFFIPAAGFFFLGGLVQQVKEVRSTAAEGRGSVTVELQLGADVARALDDIKAQVDRIQTFPAGAERPEVTESRQLGESLAGGDSSLIEPQP